MLGWARSRRTNTRQTNRVFSIGTVLVAAAAALMLAGCSGSMMADHLPNAVGGLPDGVPDRPTTEQAYPAVHNMPPQRTTTTLSEKQQKQLETDLVTVRDRTSPDAPPADAAAGNSPTGAAKKP
jgi:hypothetical protein